MSAPGKKPSWRSRFPAWRLYLALVVAYFGSVALWWFHPQMSASVFQAGVIALAAVVTGLVGLALGNPFGPILFYDLVCTSRRGRYVLIRCLYLAALLGMLFLLYVEWFGLDAVFGVQTQNHEPMDEKRIAAFNEQFFGIVMGVQYVVVVLLTPGMTAGAVADEKDRRTLDYLLTTDLGASEIVFGKLIARLATLSLILLTGLPILSLLQLLGGVDPNLLLSGFAATAMTLLSLAALSLLNSVYATKPRTAILLTYLQAGAYFVFSFVALWVYDVGKIPWPLNWLASGNIVVALEESRTGPTGPGGRPTSSLISGLPNVLLHYSLFHLVVAFVCLTLAVVGFRLWARWQASSRSRKAFTISISEKRLPRVGNRPLFWREVYAEPLFRLGMTSSIIITTFVAICLIATGFVILTLAGVALLTWLMDAKQVMNEPINIAVRIMGTVLATLCLMGVAIRASGSIGGERDRQTLDTLLTTPVENDSIVWSKWWGSILGVRKGLYMLLALWILGVVTTGVSPLAVPLLLLGWLAYAGFVAGVGMIFSLHCRTTLRATIWTMITVIGVGAGHWLLYLCCCGPFMMVTSQPPVLGGPARSESAEWTDQVMEFQKYALTPPVSLYWLTFRTEELSDSDVDDIAGSRIRIYHDSEELVLTRLTYCLIGMAIYGLTGGILLLITRGQFGAVIGRLPLANLPDKRRPSGKRKSSPK
jgi:ABC-type transport system involved in multi-copper enzyme maturation permease subunit